MEPVSQMFPDFDDREVLREQCQVYYGYPVLASDVFLFMRPDLWVHGDEITKVGFHLVLACCDPGHLTEFVCPFPWSLKKVTVHSVSGTEKPVPSSFKLTTS